MKAHASHPVARRRTLHAIALLEAIKGLAVLGASIGLLSLLHRDLRHVAHAVIAHFGMDPEAHYPAVLLHDADLLQNANLRSLLALAALYVLVRFIEAYGLWKDLAWAEWLGALSGAIYIPFEVHHLAYRPSIAGVLVFLLNVFIVGYLTQRLRQRQFSRAG